MIDVLWHYMFELLSCFENFPHFGIYVIFNFWTPSWTPSWITMLGHRKRSCNKHICKLQTSSNILVYINLCLQYNLLHFWSNRFEDMCGKCLKYGILAAILDAMTFSGRLSNQFLYILLVYMFTIHFMPIKWKWCKNVSKK